MEPCAIKQRTTKAPRIIGGCSILLLIPFLQQLAIDDVSVDLRQCCCLNCFDKWHI